MTCYIVDDEAHAIEVLARYISATPGLELLGSEEDPVVAYTNLVENKLKPEVVFLDIEMPKLSGLELAGLINLNSIIVFTTAYSNFAYEAFENNAVDYLLKPISYDRFLKSVQKVKEKSENNFSLFNKQQSSDNFCYIKSEVKGKMFKIKFEDIVFIEGLQNYIKINILSGQQYITYLTMKEVEKNLPSNFLRVHRSFIVNLAQIKMIEGNKLTLDNDAVIYIGSSYREAFLELISNTFWKSKRLGE